MKYKFKRFMISLAKDFTCSKISQKNGVVRFLNFTVASKFLTNSHLFPILAYRAVEGFNKLNLEQQIIIFNDKVTFREKGKEDINFKFYTHSYNLTEQEQRLLSCLEYIFYEKIDKSTGTEDCSDKNYCCEGHQ